jgi:hypothetical protein
MYRLVGCPPGHALVNSIGGVFSHDVQNCRACAASEYILDTNNSNFSCQTCPVGAECDGNSLHSLVAGAVWLQDAVNGIYRLRSCPPGYERQASTADAQQCLPCPASFFCVGGAGPRVACPDGTYAVARSNASSDCAPAVYVTVDASLPLAREDFPAARQASFLAALAAAAGVQEGYVALLGVTSARRRSAAASVQVSPLLAPPADTKARTVPRAALAAVALLIRVDEQDDTVSGRCEPEIVFKILPLHGLRSH